MYQHLPVDQKCVTAKGDVQVGDIVVGLPTPDHPTFATTLADFSARPQMLKAVVNITRMGVWAAPCGGRRPLLMARAAHIPWRTWDMSTALVLRIRHPSGGAEWMATGGELIREPTIWGGGAIVRDEQGQVRWVPKREMTWRLRTHHEMTEPLPLRLKVWRLRGRGAVLHDPPEAPDMDDAPF